MSSLWDDMDSILERRGPEPKASPVETTEDTVLVALFTAPTSLPPEPRECVKSTIPAVAVMVRMRMLGRRSR